MAFDFNAILIRELEVREAKIEEYIQSQITELADARLIGGEENINNYIPIINKRMMKAVQRKAEVQALLERARAGKISYK